jgi:hypothetical protein
VRRVCGYFKKRRKNVSNPYQPVSHDDHQAVFNRVQAKILAHLTGAQQSGPRPVVSGLRVAYDFADSANEPDVRPYKVESGDLGIIDQAHSPEKEIPAAAWEADEHGRRFPIAFLLKLYDETYADLHSKLTHPAPLKVRINIAVRHGPSGPKANALGSSSLSATDSGMSAEAASVDCSCPATVAGGKKHVKCVKTNMTTGKQESYCSTSVCPPS